MSFTYGDSKIPTQKLNEFGSDVPDIRVKTVYNGTISIIYIGPSITYDVMVSEMRETCSFPRTYPFTIKWMDEDGDPCTISSQRELSEAIRLYEVNKEAELTIHVFPGLPSAPGMPCHGEDSKY